MIPSLHKTKTLAFLCNSRRKKTLFHKLVIFSFKSRSKCDRKLQLAQMPLSLVCGYTGPRTGDLCSDRETTFRIKSIKCATDGTRWGSRRRLFMLWGDAEASARLGCVQTHLRWAPFPKPPVSQSTTVGAPPDMREAADWAAFSFCFHLSGFLQVPSRKR